MPKRVRRALKPGDPVFAWKDGGDYHRLYSRWGDNFEYVVERDGKQTSTFITRQVAARLIGEVALDDSGRCEIAPSCRKFTNRYLADRLFEERGESSSLVNDHPDCGHRVGPCMTIEEKDEREMFDQESHLPRAQRLTF